MKKSRIEVSDDVLNAFISLQHIEVPVEQLRSLFGRLVEDLKCSEQMERYRVCCVCQRIVRQGYVIESCDVYCSDKCLHEHISPEQYELLYDGGEGDSYWTEW